MPNVVPQMVAVPEAPNRVLPAKAKRQVQKYKRAQRKKRKNSGVRTHDVPQNALVPKGAGRSAFLGAAARNAVQAELAEQERRAANPCAPDAHNVSADWTALSATDQLSDDFNSIAEHLSDQERAELEAHLAEVRQLSAEAAGGSHRPTTPEEADLFKQFAHIGEHLTDAERAELEAEMEEVKRLSVSVSQSREELGPPPDLEQLSAAFEGLAEHLDADAKKELEAEVAAVARLSQELGEPTASGSSWGSQINERSQTAPGSSAAVHSGAKRQRSKRRKSGHGLVAPSQLETRSQFEPFTGDADPTRPTSRDSMKHYLIKRPLASPNSVNVEQLQVSGKGSLGLSWDEFRKGERLRSVTDMHSIDNQLERRKKAELAALWADRTVPTWTEPKKEVGPCPHWTGPCSVPPLAMPEPSLIGVTRVADTIRDVFKGETIQHEERTPRTANWQSAELSQYEVALRDGPARACTAKVAPGVPALNSRPVHLGAYVDRFWAGPSLAGLDKQKEVQARRERKVSRKDWSNINRPPAQQRAESIEHPTSPKGEIDEEEARFRSCTLKVTAVPAEYADNDVLMHVFSGFGRFLQGTCDSDSVKEDLIHGSGAWGLVTFANEEDIAVVLQAAQDKALKVAGSNNKLVEVEVVKNWGQIKSTEEGARVWEESLSKATFEFSQLETKVLESAGLLIELVEATGLPSMDLCGLSDPYAVILVNNRKTPTEAVCDSKKSKVVKKTKEPEWNQEFALPVPINVVPDAELIIDIFGRFFLFFCDFQ